jgi:hypothetical protein
MIGEYGRLEQRFDKTMETPLKDLVFPSPAILNFPNQPGKSPES